MSTNGRVAEGEENCDGQDDEDEGREHDGLSVFKKRSYVCFNKMDTKFYAGLVVFYLRKEIRIKFCITDDSAEFLDRVGVGFFDGF